MTQIQVENERGFGWMKEKQMPSVSKQMYLLSKTLSLIQENEKKYRVCIEESRSNLSAIAYPETRMSYLRMAGRARIRAERLTKEFNIMAMELSL